MDIFNIKSGQSRNTFNLPKQSLRQGLNDFIDEHPNWMVYVRRDERFAHTTCLDPVTKSPDPQCEECFGTGYVVTFEKHKTRRVIRASDAKSPIQPFGYLSEFSTVIYTPRYYYPKSKDIYIEVEWDTSLTKIETLGKPTGIINIFQVDEPVAFREDEVTYFGCKCDTYNFNLPTIESWLKRLSSVWEVPTEL